jgi:hypothetical protein
VPPSVSVTCPGSVILNPGSSPRTWSTPGGSPDSSKRPSAFVTARAMSLCAPVETMTVTPGSTEPLSSRTALESRAVPVNAAAWVCGMSPGPVETATVGRVANSGAESGWRNA